jgi:hypothetical protein
MEQQTAVEWLAEIIRFANKELYAEMFEEIKQAKQMEKEQREKDFIGGYKKRAELSNLMFDKASELFARSLFNEINKTK